LPVIIKAPIELNKVEDAQAVKGVNRVEALTVVRRIKEIWQQQDTLSLGVITLNVKQKDLIDDLLFEEAQLNNAFANRLEQERINSKDGEDIGFFVRSVEHVQGDERDIIILSTVYDGVRKNFGAITKKEKGRKRLNVAITRAKLGMIIYSSLNIDGISNDNQRDESENYWFWKYLCYAKAISSGYNKTAKSVLQSLNPTFHQPCSDTEPDSYFEEDVVEFLRTNNYHVDYQIGESGFSIDLGVKRNDNDRLYLCGIECDGRQYHNSWSARLNDIWRQKILANKGWRIVRIWSDDWFDNREQTQKKLLAQLETQKNVFNVDIVDYH
jgi:REase_MTES_1575/AAA domain